MKQKILVELLLNIELNSEIKTVIKSHLEKLFRSIMDRLAKPRVKES